MQIQNQYESFLLSPFGQSLPDGMSNGVREVVRVFYLKSFSQGDSLNREKTWVTMKVLLLSRKMSIVFADTAL